MYSKAHAVCYALCVSYGWYFVLCCFGSPNVIYFFLSLFYTKIDVFFLCIVSVDLLRNYTFNLLWRIVISYSAERFGIIEFQPLSFRSVRIT